MPPSPYRQSLEHTIRFVRDLDRSRNLEDLSTQVLRHLSQIGAEHVIAGTYPRPGPNRRQQHSHSLFANWPEEWLERYLARGYLLKDPIMLRTISGNDPFFWNELDQDVRDDPAAQQVMDESAEFGLKKGFSTSLVTLDGQKVGFSVAGRNFDHNPEMRGVLTLIASYAIGRAIALRQEATHTNKEIVLSAREREALQWAAEGKNDWEIGEVMKISEHGADKHLRSVRMKLGAINRTQAVAEALRRGLIV